MGSSDESGCCCAAVDSRARVGWSLGGQGSAAVAVQPPADD